MSYQQPITDAIAELIDESLPAHAQPWVLGDFITAAEIANATGTHVIVLAHDLMPNHLRLLLKAADQVVAGRIQNPDPTSGPEPR